MLRISYDIVISNDGILSKSTEFVARNALQCGFCTPGILLTAAEIVAEDRCFSRQEIRNELSGNICRCTGYQAIIDAIEMVLIENIKKK